MKPTAIVLNGHVPYRGFDKNGLFYPVAPIPELISLNIHNIKPAHKIRFSLEDYSNSSLSVLDVKADFKEDSDTE